MEGTTDDIEYLVSSDHRIAVLETLANGPSDRNDLRATTGASSPTMGRILTGFQERYWIEREGRLYQLTRLGEFVATQFGAFQHAMATQRRLREVWSWLPHELEDFDLTLFTDIVVSQPGLGYPYEPVERLTELMGTTGTMYGFGMALLKSRNLEPFFDQIGDGLVCEYIYPPAVFESLLEWDHETVLDAAAHPNYTVLLHDELPLDQRCGICLFDHAVSICCYNPETGMLQSLVDTESDEMRTWADASYERYREEAQPLENATDWLSIDGIS